VCNGKYWGQFLLFGKVKIKSVLLRLKPRFLMVGGCSRLEEIYASFFKPKKGDNRFHWHSGSPIRSNKIKNTTKEHVKHRWVIKYVKYFALNICRYYIIRLQQCIEPVHNMRILWTSSQNFRAHIKCSHMFLRMLPCTKFIAGPYSLWICAA
jgi:hypothetical protein